MNSKKREEVFAKLGTVRARAVALGDPELLEVTTRLVELLMFDPDMTSETSTKVIEPTTLGGVSMQSVHSQVMPPPAEAPPPPSHNEAPQEGGIVMGFMSHGRVDTGESPPPSLVGGTHTDMREAQNITAPSPDTVTAVEPCTLTPGCQLENNHPGHCRGFNVGF